MTVSEIMRRNICNKYKDGYNISEIVHATQISRASIYRILREDPDVIFEPSPFKKQNNVCYSSCSSSSSDCSSSSSECSSSASYEYSSDDSDESNLTRSARLTVAQRYALYAAMAAIGAAAISMKVRRWRTKTSQ